MVIEFEGVWKKFRKGERLNSLRDLIPAIFRNNFNNYTLASQEFWSLSDISFKLQRGKSLGIIGPNGAGKSTILKLLSKILKPTKGHINVNVPVSAMIELGTGFHQDLTGADNIYLSGTIMGMSKREIDRKFDEIVEFSGLSEFIATPVKRYSSGMFARLGFAVATHTTAGVILVDEVLSVGDAGFQAKCLKKISDIMQDGTSVVFVSHFVKQVASICPDILVLDKGRSVFYGEASKAIDVYYDLFANCPKNCEIAKNQNTITVSLVDENLNLLKSLDFLTPVNFLVTCSIKPDFPKSTLVIKIGNNYGVDYVNLNSLSNSVIICPGFTQLLCKAHNCNLLPNTYKITAYLTDPISSQVLESFLIQRDLTVTVQEMDVYKSLPNPEKSAFYVPSQWEILETKQYDG